MLQPVMALDYARACWIKQYSLNGLGGYGLSLKIQ